MRDAPISGLMTCAPSVTRKSCIKRVNDAKHLIRSMPLLWHAAEGMIGKNAMTSPRHARYDA
eukprot:scaffold229483_cov29-Prasinocladus_malaysianus.AAC.1